MCLHNCPSQKKTDDKNPNLRMSAVAKREIIRLLLDRALTKSPKTSQCRMHCNPTSGIFVLAYSQILIQPTCAKRPSCTENTIRTSKGCYWDIETVITLENWSTLCVFVLIYVFVWTPRCTLAVFQWNFHISCWSWTIWREWTEIVQNCASLPSSPMQAVRGMLCNIRVIGAPQSRQVNPSPTVAPS